MTKIKKAKTNVLLIILLITATINNSCQKTGPTGPTGKDGSSNVTTTNYTANSWSWSSPYYYVNFSVPELTSSNVNSAAVMVYFTLNTSWSALPFTQYNSPYDYFMGFNTSVGNVQVTWFYDSSLSSGSDPNAYYSTTVKYKVVVIPPSQRKTNLDLSNYEKVKQAYNLKD